MWGREDRFSKRFFLLHFSDSGISCESTVDRDDRSVDEAGGVVVDEPEEGSDEVVGYAEAVHGGVGEDFLGAGGVGAVGVDQ